MRRTSWKATGCIIGAVAALFAASCAQVGTSSDEADIKSASRWLVSAAEIGADYSALIGRIDDLTALSLEVSEGKVTPQLARISGEGLQSELRITFGTIAAREVILGEPPQITNYALSDIVEATKDALPMQRELVSDQLDAAEAIYRASLDSDRGKSFAVATMQLDRIVALIKGYNEISIFMRQAMTVSDPTAALMAAAEYSRAALAPTLEATAAILRDTGKSEDLDTARYRAREYLDRARREINRGRALTDQWSNAFREAESRGGANPNILSMAKAMMETLPESFDVEERMIAAADRFTMAATNANKLAQAEASGTMDAYFGPIMKELEELGEARLRVDSERIKILSGYR